MIQIENSRSLQFLCVSTVYFNRYTLFHQYHHIESTQCPLRKWKHCLTNIKNSNKLTISVKIIPHQPHPSTDYSTSHLTIINPKKTLIKIRNRSRTTAINHLNAHPKGTTPKKWNIREKLRKIWMIHPSSDRGSIESTWKKNT